MATIQIPQLPLAIGVDGTEQMEAVQGGVSVRVTTAMIASLASEGSLVPEPANTVFAGPTSGTPDLPSFRALVSDDIPTIDNDKLADVATATFKGRATAGTGSPEDLSAAQATALLNVMVGDSGSGGTKGLAPAPAAGDAAAGKFLKADGTYQVPAGGGGGSGTVTSVGLSAPSEFSVSNSPVTTSGTLTFAWSSAVTAAHGGTGLASYTTGDILYASGTTALSALSDIATGNALLSGGVGTAPAWGKIGLTTHITGTLALANGGLGITSGTSGGIPYFSSASAVASSGALTAHAIVLGGGAGAAPTPLGSLGAATTVLHGNASGAPTFSAVALAADVSGTLPVANGGTGITNNPNVLSLTFILNGGGSTLATGVWGDLTVPFACTISQWTLLPDQSGSVVIDIWKDTYANYPPTVADSITGSAKPTISATTKAQSSTLTGWTTTINAGDTLRINVNSATTITRVTLSLTVTRT